LVTKKPATYLTERFHLAVKYATFWHRHQVRKSTDLTYILHPLGVASLVLEAGGNEDEAIAALLHDIPEDCGGQVMLEEIEALFGPRVAEIVAGCSDTLVEDRANKALYRERKQGHIDHIKKSHDKGLHLVTAADKLHNARAIVTDLQNEGDVVWKRFNADKATILWYYDSMMDVLVQKSVSKSILTPLASAIEVMRGQN
jgi:(p)ppGpp synthase/HD superfamily hydrolase